MNTLIEVALAIFFVFQIYLEIPVLRRKSMGASAFQAQKIMTDSGPYPKNQNKSPKL